jgi:ABC-type Na+ efflux pump permease subunit
MCSSVEKIFTGNLRRELRRSLFFHNTIIIIIIIVIIIIIIIIIIIMIPSRVFIENLIVAYLVKKFADFYATK